MLINSRVEVGVESLVRVRVCYCRVESRGVRRSVCVVLQYVACIFIQSCFLLRPLSTQHIRYLILSLLDSPALSLSLTSPLRLTRSPLPSAYLPA